jgi:hypothetical protein
MRPTLAGKLFDWVAGFGIVLVVLLVSAAVAQAQEKPDKKKRGDKSKVVEEGGSGDDEGEGDVIEIVVKIPKPEALIFSRRMKTKYQTVEYEKSFLNEVVESAKQDPF